MPCRTSPAIPQQWLIANERSQEHPAAQNSARANSAAALLHGWGYTRCGEQRRPCESRTSAMQPCSSRLVQRRLLTDPNFDDTSREISPSGQRAWYCVQRDLPSLDAILLTHAHADHLSFRSLDRLPREIPLFAPPAVATWLIRLGYSHARPLPADSQVPLEMS